MPLQYPVLYRTMDIKADQIVANAVATAIRDAETLWDPEKFDGIFPVRGFGIKRLEKFDVDDTGGTHGHPYTNSWIMSFTTARTWTGLLSNTLSNACYIVLTGIFNYDANLDVRAIKITADGVEYPIINLEEMYGWDVATAYFSHPIVVRPEKKIIVEGIANTAGQKNFGFIGYTIAKRSYLIGKMS